MRNLLKYSFLTYYEIVQKHLFDVDVTPFKEMHI